MFDFNVDLTLSSKDTMQLITNLQQFRGCARGMVDGMIDSPERRFFINQMVTVNELIYSIEHAYSAALDDYLDRIGGEND